MPLLDLEKRACDARAAPRVIVMPGAGADDASTVMWWPSTRIVLARAIVPPTVNVMLRFDEERASRSVPGPESASDVTE